MKQRKRKRKKEENMIKYGIPLNFEKKAEMNNELKDEDRRLVGEKDGKYKRRKSCSRRNDNHNIKRKRFDSEYREE